MNTDLFKPNESKKIEFEKKNLILRKMKLFFYMLEELIKTKVSNNILKVSKLLSNLNYKCRFIFVGNYEDENLKHEIKKNKRIIYINHSRNINKFYQFADIYIASSYREGFGMTVAQAMASGLPVIGTNIYGLKDLLKNGRNCITYDPDNINKLF